jgi:hypothetical protein
MADITNTIPAAAEILARHEAEPGAYQRYAKAVIDHIAAAIDARSQEVIETGILVTLPEFEGAMPREAWNRIGAGVAQALENRGYASRYVVDDGVVQAQIVIADFE